MGMKKNILSIFSILLIVFVVFWFSVWRRHSIKTGIPEVILVGTSADFKPFSFKDINGTITGFDIDLTQEIVNRLGKTMEIQDMAFDLLIPQLQMGNIYLIAAGMTPTKERSERVIFTAPYLTGDPLWIVTLKSNTVSGIKDLEHKNVIVNQGYTADIYLSKIPTINLQRLPSIADALLALNSGRAFAFVTAANSVRELLEQYPDKYTISPIEDTDESSALAIAPDYPDLAFAIKSTLQNMENDGSLRMLKEKWHVQ